MPVSPLLVSVVDGNSYILPYVRVEIEDLKRNRKSEAQNLGRYYDGPFYEGRHRVVVKLGNDSDAMTEVVYDRVHDFTKDMKTLGITLENVRQRFDIEVAEQAINIPVVEYTQRKDIFIRPYEEGKWVQRNDISAPFELRVFDDIEDILHADIHSFLIDFQYVTFIRQEYPVGKWIYHVVFTNSYPKPHDSVGGTYNFAFSTPNVSFTVSQDVAVMNRLTYSSPNLTMSGFTIVQTTFETKDFLSK
ncbi:MAG: hypothetical protein HYT64_01835 [Candidatus Yanofskybacteria bacterium]|nr:hypothetical protein [Candidatus Yanofskybacteria bacterium]